MPEYRIERIDVTNGAIGLTQASRVSTQAWCWANGSVLGS